MASPADIVTGRGARVNPGAANATRGAMRLPLWAVAVTCSLYSVHQPVLNKAFGITQGEVAKKDREW